jgi:adenylate cyclase
MLRRDVDQAIVHYEKAVEVMESDFHAWAILVTCYGANGDRKKIKRAAEKMVSEGQKALQQDPSNGAALGIMAGGFAILGDADRAREWIDRAMLIDPDNLNMRYNFACVLATHLQDKDAALTLLERCLARGGELLVRHAESDPDFDCLRNDPRFAKALAAAKRRLKLEELPAGATAAAATPSAA